MDKDDVFYGMDGQEILDSTVEEVVEKLIDDAWEKDFSTTADKMIWPIEVYVFKRMEIGNVEKIGEYALEHILEHLDEEYGDPDGDYTEPTDKMKEAAKGFGRAIKEHYVPWGCERTGEIIKVTRDEALDII